jgi:S-methylmethionine-dependent homocysteine/selenocysteine methylase
MYDFILSKLQHGEPVLLDGSPGAELVRRGIRWRQQGLRTDLAAVEQVHADYIAAGAQVIRTNTFQLSHRTYLNVFHHREHMRHIGAPGLETQAVDLWRAAVAAAQAARARSGQRVAIAGVLSPLEHCFRPDLSPAYETALAEHQEKAAALAEAGVDLLFLESMNTMEEARAALAACRAAGKPVWISFVLGPELEILSKEKLEDGVAAMISGGADAVLVSAAPPADVSAGAPRLVAAAAGRKPCGGLAFAGRFDPPSWKFEFHPQFVPDCAPQAYASMARQWRAAGLRILGGDGGVTPQHIAALTVQ